MKRFVLAFDGGKALTTQKKAVMLRNTLWGQIFEIGEGEGLELSLEGVDTMNEEFVREFFGWLFQKEKDGLLGERLIFVLDDGEPEVTRLVTQKVEELRGVVPGAAEDQFRDMARLRVRSHGLTKAEAARDNQELVR